MLKQRRPWQEELAIIDRTMKAISGVTDPEELVEIYWNGIGELIAIDDYVAVSRRNVDSPFYLITRSSRFTEHYNPWTQRKRLPRMSGGLLGEIGAVGTLSNQRTGRRRLLRLLPAKRRPMGYVHR